MTAGPLPAPARAHSRRAQKRNIHIQLWAVAAATGASLLYALVIAPAAFPDYIPTEVPAVPWFIGFLIAAAVVWVAATPTNEHWTELGELFGIDLEDPIAPRTRALLHLSRVVALFALVVLSVLLLSWSTLSSGGTLASPFAGALIALALLSPFIASGWVAPIFSFVLVLAAFWLCSGIAFPVDSDGLVVPNTLIAVSATVTNTIAIAIAVFVKRGEARRPARRRSRAARDDVTKLVNTSNYDETHTAIAAISTNANVDDLSKRQARRLLNAALTNPQIYGIGRDDDVQRFFSELADLHSRNQNEDEQQHLNKHFGVTTRRRRPSLKRWFARYVEEYGQP